MAPAPDAAGGSTAGDARERVRAAAASLFAARGYSGTTLRAIARDAGVDVALVPYYFGNKAGLFAAVVALPVNPGVVVRRVFEDGLDGVGERILRTYLGFWEAPESGPALASLVRTWMTDEAAAKGWAEFVETAILGVYRQALGGGPDAEVRAQLAAQQLLGLALVRYLLRVEPMASMPIDDVVAVTAPILQATLTGPLASVPATRQTGRRGRRPRGSVARQADS